MSRQNRLQSTATLLLIASLIVACGEAPQSFADRQFINARAYTLDARQPWADTVQVTGNVITYVGDRDGGKQNVGPKTRTHDLDGKMLLPGFIDTHMHPIAGGAFARALALDTFGSVDDWLLAIQEYASANEDARVIFGYGFLASTFGPKGPTRQLIDDIVDDRPVLIMDEGFHGAWANSSALQRLGITRDTIDPVPGFSYYKRDQDGVATGYLLEGTAGLAMNALDVITEDVVVDGTELVIDTLNSFGVTSAFDAGAIGYEDMLQRVLSRLSAAGELTVRLVGAYRPTGPEDLDQALAGAVDWRNTVVGDNYHYRGLKLMDDGTVEGRTAAMFEDYQGEPGNSGATVFTQEELSSTAVGAAALDIDLHIHALGERAVHEALNAIGAARTAHPESDSRYTICHIQVILDQDLPRFAELDVIAQSTPLWAVYDTYGKQFVSEDQFNRYWRFNSLRELGVKLTFGSDFPASGAGALGMSPLFNIEIGHTRQEPGNPDAPVQPRESERLDIDTLIRGYTIDAAYQLHLENEIGSIEIGKKADLVVLNGNLFDVDPYQIGKMTVAMTMQDGTLVYQASE